MQVLVKKHDEGDADLLDHHHNTPPSSFTPSALLTFFLTTTNDYLLDIRIAGDVRNKNKKLQSE